MQVWGTEICQRDDLRILAFDLLDPSKPHFEKLENAANLIASITCLYPKWRGFDRFWDLRWHAEPHLSEAKTLINFELGKKFLENHDIKDVMRTQLDLEYKTLENLKIFRFKGSVRKFCERASEEIVGLDHFRLFLDDVAEYLDH